jgi:hypothetical protein
MDKDVWSKLLTSYERFGEPVSIISHVLIVVRSYLTPSAPNECLKIARN